MKLRKKVLLLMCICLANISPAVIADEHWELKTRANNIDTFVGTVADSEYKAARHMTHINAPVNVIIKALVGGEGCKPWLSMCISSTILDQINENEYLGYAVIDMPWPLSNRDVVFRSTMTIQDATGVVEINQVAEPKSYPASQWVRMISTNHYLLEPITEQSVRFTWTVHSNPGGKVPASLVNSKIHKNTRKDLMSLLQLLKGH